jgi:hypothetical protein
VGDKTMKKIFISLFSFLMIIIFASNASAWTTVYAYDNPDPHILLDLDGDMGGITSHTVNLSVSENFSYIYQVVLKIWLYDDPTDLTEEHAYLTVGSDPADDIEVNGWDQIPEQHLYILDDKPTNISFTLEPHGYWKDSVWDTDSDFKYRNAIFSVKGTLAPVPIPIPGAAWFLASGLIGFVGLKRKLKKIDD